MIYAIVKVKSDRKSFITMTFGKSLEEIKKPRGFFINGDIIWTSELEVLEYQKTEYSLYQAQQKIKNYAQQFGAIFEEIL